MDYVAFEIRITAVMRGEGPDEAEQRPTALAYIDVSDGHPILLREGRTGAPGISTTEAWAGLDLTQLTAALPKVATAPQLEATPSIEAPQKERHRERRTCPKCHRMIEVRVDGKFIRHNVKANGGAPCGQLTPSRKRNSWPPAPADVLHLFETKYNGSYVALGQAFSVPDKIAGNWVYAARAKAAKQTARQTAQQAELAALPIHDLDADPPAPPALDPTTPTHRPPADILEIFATKYNSDYSALVAAYGISKTKAYSWVNDARARARKEAAKQTDMTPTAEEEKDDES